MMSSKPFSVRGRSGFVLIITLMVVALLTVVLVEFHYNARLGHHGQTNLMLGRQAEHAAQAGLEVALAAIEQYPEGSWPHNGKRITGRPISFALGDTFVEVAIEAEHGKLSLNHLLDANDQWRRDRVDQLLRLIDLMNENTAATNWDYGLAPAIIDWLDADNQPTILPFIQGDNKGAELDYYRQQDDSRTCLNRRAVSLAELVPCRGWHGTQCSNENHRSTPKTAQWEQFVTVYGEGLIDINEAPALVLQSLSEGIDGPTAESIISARQTQPLQSLTQLQAVAGIDAATCQSLAESITFTPQTRCYRIMVTARVASVRQHLTVIAACPSGTGAARIWYRDELQQPPWSTDNSKDTVSATGKQKIPQP